MNDSEILQMYFARNDSAVAETEKKYGPYCRSIAAHILGSREDAEECVNDALLHAWNAIPPHRPEVLSAFLGRLTRNLAFNRWRSRRAEKRGSGEIALVLEELGECVPGGEDAEAHTAVRELREAIQAFLDTLPAQRRGMFLRRYWYVEPIADIAARYGVSQRAVSSALARVRNKLRNYLTERGFDL